MFSGWSTAHRYLQPPNDTALLYALEELGPDPMEPASMSTTASECIPPDKNPNGSHRGERVRRPTRKVIQAQLDAIPVAVDIPEPQTLQLPRVRLLLRPTHVQERNSFGLSRSHKGVPSSIPDQPNTGSYIPDYSHPEPPKATCTVEEIIHPYPNLSSFLLDHCQGHSTPTLSACSGLVFGH